jgi:hypothetical protein
VKYRVHVRTRDISGRAVTTAPWADLISWCEQQYGPPAMDRWWPKQAYEIRFAHEIDHMVFLLKWAHWGK